jgi:hypothetical protein
MRSEADNPHALIPRWLLLCSFLSSCSQLSHRHDGNRGEGFVLLFLLLLLERLQTMTNDGLLLTEYIVMGRKLCSEPLTNADLEVFLGTDHYATIYTSPHQLGPDCASRCGSVSGLEASFDKNHVAPATCCSYLRFTSAAVCDHCYCTCAATNC